MTAQATLAEHSGESAMTLEENKTLVRRFNDDAFNRRDLEARDRFLGPNFAVNGVVVDRAQARAKVAALFTAFPDFHRALEDIVAEGDKVVARYTARGTHQGEFMGIPATGKHVTFRWITIYRLEGDRVAEEWPLFDALGLLQQLGVITLPRP
jgi:steroid delta-isomerase-like uncharacterized protein